MRIGLRRQAAPSSVHLFELLYLGPPVRWGTPLGCVLDPLAGRVAAVAARRTAATAGTAAAATDTATAMYVWRSDWRILHGNALLRQPCTHLLS